ncbi:MAG TPA: class I SAM-dependent methyltransferase, partial [Myxococcales bacterium]|nr:class I SAM-dependent methyltransferase [Myxococcales bacterium]
YHALRDRGLLSASAVMEVGAGAGFISAAFQRESGGALRYTFVDLSSPLLAVQRRQLQGAAAVRADAERLPFRDASFPGLVLANEVIADLETTRDASGALVNAGAARFAAELWRVLAPGGSACLTEFGGDFRPRGVWLSGALGRGGHLEHSIHFGELQSACLALGFQVERLKVAELLGLDGSVRVASYHDLLRLRRLVRDLPIYAFPKEELEARHPVLTRLFRFELPPIGSPAFPHPGTQGGFAQLFEALLLRKG